MKKTHIIRLTCVVAVMAIANLIYWPPRTNYLRTSAEPPPTSQRRIFERIMQREKPRIILLGNSILGYGVDERKFESGVGKYIRVLHFGGGASAWWYLTLKNILLAAPQKPQMVAIFFRDHYLTDPTFRVTGYYKQYIDWMTTESEPVLDRLAYQADQSPMIRFVSRWIPLYQQKNRLTSLFQKSVKSAATAFFPRSAGDSADAAIDRFFADQNMDRVLLTARQLSVESVSSDRQYDFDDQVKKSFLPYMIQDAAKNNVQLVFVRMKRRRDAGPDRQPQKLIEYTAKLKDYLQEHHCPFLDFTDDPRITLDLYADGDHFSTRGKEVFTPILIEAMKPLIK
jgi:hypothetical protein